MGKKVIQEYYFFSLNFLEGKVLLHLHPSYDLTMVGLAAIGVFVFCVGIVSQL